MSGTRRLFLSGILAAIANDSAMAKRRHKRTRRRKGPKPAPVTRLPIEPHCWPIGSAIRVIDAASPAWSGAIAATVERWNARFPLVQLRVERGTEGVDVPDAGVVTILSPVVDDIWHGVMNPRYGPGGHLNGATVLFDEADYLNIAPNDPVRAALVCHELGHALGAYHSPAGTGGCMAEDRVAQGDPVIPGEWTLANLVDAYTACPPELGENPYKRKKKDR